MVDFHTHILPGIDDGSHDSEMTEAMLKEEYRQGVGLIVATPHFYADRMSVDGFLQRRGEALATVQELRSRIADEEGKMLPEIIPGAEVYYFKGIGGAKEIPKFCIGQTNTLLLEMPFVQWDKEVVGDVRELIERQKVHIVLAHIERYPEFQKKKDAWEEVLSLPLQFQINAGSFIKKGGFFSGDRKRRFCLEFAAKHPFFLLGSDCHNMTSRRPNLARGRTAIEQSLGEEALRCIDDAVRTALEA